MKEMLVLMATSLPTEKVIELMEEAIADYREAVLLQKDLEHAKHDMIVKTHLLTLHFMNLDKGIDGAIETIKKMEDMEKANNFFKTVKN